MGITLRKNSQPVKDNPFYHYNPHSGYFGEYQEGNKSKVRVIYTENDPKDEARALFEKLAKGVVVNEDVPQKKWHVRLDDGSIITLRINHPTPDHAPAVMICVKNSVDSANIKGQKIHFVKKGQ